MIRSTRRGPALFCYDGSEGSLGAMRAAGALIEPSAEVIVLTVWEPIAVRLALAGAFATGFPYDGNLDAQEESFATTAAKEGVERAAAHGYTASAVTRRALEGIAPTILAVADEFSARLIVCGQRGRSRVRSALLGSVSHALAAHTRRPVLIAPEGLG